MSPVIFTQIKSDCLGLGTPDFALLYYYIIYYLFTKFIATIIVKTNKSKINEYEIVSPKNTFNMVKTYIYCELSNRFSKNVSCAGSLVIGGSRVTKMGHKINKKK